LKDLFNMYKLNFIIINKKVSYQ